MRIHFAHRADAHVGARHMGRILEDGRSSALVGQHAALTDFLEQAKNAGVSAILNAGDETHTPRPTPDELQVLMDYHELREEAGIREYAVEGNHTDRPGVTITDIAGRYDHVYASTEPELTTARFELRKGEELAEVQIAMLPWLPRNRVKSAEDLTAAAVDIIRGLVAQLDRTIPSILIVHATIAGGETSTGFSMGFIPDELGYKIPLEELAPFTYVAAGHLHRPQQLAPNVVYAGSLFPVDFAESHEHGWQLVTLCNEADGGTNELLDALGKHVGYGWHAHVQFRAIATPPIVTADVHEEGGIADTLPDPRDALVRARVFTKNGGAHFPAQVTQALYDAGALMVQTEVIRPARPDLVRSGKVLTPQEALVDAVGPREDAPRILALAAEQLERLRPAGVAAGGGTLHLRRIEAENIMRISQAKVDLEAGTSLVSVTGPVGSGKSALFCDVPRLAFTGASRAGDRPSEGIIREGCTYGLAAVELVDDAGARFRIARTFRRKKAGGITTQLDVLREEASTWEPLTDGKIASGEAVVATLLGGLDDRTLKASTFVVQREADAFTSAAPEDRKRVLAEAAGLGHIDVLAQDALDIGREAAQVAKAQYARADGIRPRVAELEVLEQEARGIEEATLPALEQGAGHVREVLARAEQTFADAQRDQERRAVLERDFRAKQETVVRLGSDLTKLSQDIAQAELARATLATIERDVATLGGHTTAALDKAQSDREHAAKLDRTYREAFDRRALAQDELRRWREEHTRVLSRTQTLLEGARSRAKLLDEAKCCEPEPVCVLLTDARAAAAHVPELEQEIAKGTEPDRTELGLENAVVDANAAGADKWPLDMKPFEDALRVATANELRADSARKRTADLTPIAARLEELTARRLDVGQALAAAERDRDVAAEELDVLTTPVQAARVAALLDVAKRDVETHDAAIAKAKERIAFLRGRVEALAQERDELLKAETVAAAAAQRAADAGELNVAWKRARVLILDGSVIPAVEAVANEILALSPTGLTLRLDRDEGDALELRLEGGLAPSYRLASGGQRTWVDVALHIAIALVVAQRVQTRLDFLFVDEPEGLDLENRAHFGRVLRWVHDTHGLTVLAASHHEDLVELVADRVITLAPTAEGTTV